VPPNGFGELLLTVASKGFVAQRVRAPLFTRRGFSPTTIAGAGAVAEGAMFVSRASLCVVAPFHHRQLV